MQHISGSQDAPQGKLQPSLGDRPLPGVPFVMAVKGDCMEPEVHINDVIVCVPCPVPNDGDMIVVQTSSGFQLRRYVVADGCHPYLVANNSSYGMAKLGAEHKICGKVIEIQAKR